MKCFEYLVISVDPGDLTKLNALGSTGFEIACSKPTEVGFEIILKRELKGNDKIKTINFYEILPKRNL